MAVIVEVEEWPSRKEISVKDKRGVNYDKEKYTF